MTTELIETKDGFWSTRLRVGQGKQLRLTVAVKDKAVAVARFERLRTLSHSLIGKGLTKQAVFLLQKAAAQTSAAAFELAVEMGFELAPPRVSSGRFVTFEDVGKAWTSGELHRLYPDHVKLKKTSERDAGRLALLYPTIGHIALADFDVEDALGAMRVLPKSAKRPAARRHYAQVIAKVLRLAEFPCGGPRYPLPKGFLPKIPKGDLLFQHLYPEEETRLMACLDVPLAERVFYGFIHREGCRTVEALELQWRNLNREHGTITTTHVRKNGRLGEWDAAPGTLDAVNAALRETTQLGPFEGLPNDGQWAKRYRAALLAAGIDRAELHGNEAGRRQMRAHDMRATYVTLALARGASEAEIMRNTGHMSSGQIVLYNHAAGAWRRMGRGQLLPLGDALGIGNPFAVVTDSSGGGETEGETEPMTGDNLVTKKPEENRYCGPSRTRTETVENRGILNPSSDTVQHENTAKTSARGGPSTPSVSPFTGGVSHESIEPRLLLDESTLWALLELCTRHKRPALLSTVSGQLEEIERVRAASVSPKVASLDAARAKREGGK